MKLWFGQILSYDSAHMKNPVLIFFIESASSEQGKRPRGMGANASSRFLLGSRFSKGTRSLRMSILTQLLFGQKLIV